MDIFQIKEQIKKNKELLTEIRKEVATILDIHFSKMVLSTNQNTVTISVPVSQGKKYDRTTFEKLNEKFATTDWSLMIERGMIVITLTKEDKDEEKGSFK
jgi:hypothetical protein